MSSFPTRPLANDFGPEFRNLYPVENPETDADADAFGNRVRWQVAGMGLVVPRGVLVAEWSGATMDILMQEEAWNPNRLVARPVLDRTATGVYTYTFQSSYDDKDGTAVATQIFGAQCSVNSTAHDGYAEMNTGNIISIEIYHRVTGAAADERFMLTYW